ncbi:response regulator transcription factor [Pantoea eucrina]|uniref:response regulator transcription factor n=1 Tax=Pantoea eucrina TaxID=472693 RepID=UPI002FD91942
MFTLTVIDNDKWIAAGIADYFKARHIQTILLSEGQPQDILAIAARLDVVISEICACGLDMQAMTELLVKLRQISPLTRLIILTDIDEAALLGYVQCVLPGVTILSKRCDMAMLTASVFGNDSLSAAQTHADKRASGSSALTRREFELLRLLAVHHTLTDISAVLKLSIKTISHHRKSIMRKLHCRTWIELPLQLERIGYHRIRA